MIHVVVGDLASTEADAVVRAATSLLEPAAKRTEVDRLAESPGWQPLPANRPLDIGAAVVTDGGSLEAEYVVHAVILSAAKPVSADGLRRAIQSVLERCNDWQFRTVAMPVLGGDATELGLETASRILVDTLYGGRSATYPSDVCIVVGSEEGRSVVDAFLRSRQAHES